MNGRKICSGSHFQNHLTMLGRTVCLGNMLCRRKVIHGRYSTHGRQETEKERGKSEGKVPSSKHVWMIYLL